MNRRAFLASAPVLACSPGLAPASAKGTVSPVLLVDGFWFTIRCVNCFAEKTEGGLWDFRISVTVGGDDWFRWLTPSALLQTRLCQQGLETTPDLTAKVPDLLGTTADPMALRQQIDKAIAGIPDCQLCVDMTPPGLMP